MIKLVWNARLRSGSLLSISPRCIATYFTNSSSGESGQFVPLPFGTFAKYWRTDSEFFRCSATAAVAVLTASDKDMPQSIAGGVNPSRNVSAHDIVYLFFFNQQSCAGPYHKNESVSRIGSEANTPFRELVDRPLVVGLVLGKVCWRSALVHSESKNIDVVNFLGAHNHVRHRNIKSILRRGVVGSNSARYFGRG